MYLLNKKLNSLLDREDQKRIPLFIFIVLIGSFLEVLGLSILIPITNFILNPTNLIESKYSGAIFFLFKNISYDNLFKILVFIFFISYSIKNILLFGINLYQVSFGFKFNKKLSNYFYKNYLYKEYYTYNDLSSSQFVRNSIFEIDKLTEYLINSLKFITEIITFVIIVAFLFLYNFYSTLIICSLILIFTTTYYLIFRSKILKIALNKQIYENMKIKFLNSAFGGIKDIKMSFSENYFYNKFNELNKMLMIAHSKNALYNIMPRFLLEVFLIGLLCFYFLLGKKTGMNFDSISASIPIYLLAFLRLFPSSNKILLSLQAMRLNKPSLNLMFDKIDSYKNYVNIDKSDPTNLNFKKSIRINIKNFKYSNKSNFQLKNINFEIKKNEKIGIIGQTGSGKSTLIELLINIIYLQNGDILVDKNSTKNFVKSWRNAIGYIPQKIYILDDNLKNNICLNEKYKKHSDKYFINIIRKAGLYKWYKSLPKGLKTNIDERGLSLSGGEIQRIGIARALVHNPQILILDEATSGLDSFTEKKILSNLFNLKNKTFIFISHREETLKKFSKIYILKNGKLNRYKNL